ALALIAAGAIGNLIDRVRFGQVTDFLDFYWRGYNWPGFNIADSAITVGVALFLLASWRQRPASKSDLKP
ncbi:MAG TPA: signal peptidase II, partial [Desulfurivibrio alkaliphilus]|nr:signal peptidase II [Desulfurivibrio alkaliphilus]